MDVPRVRSVRAAPPSGEPSAAEHIVTADAIDAASAESSTPRKDGRLCRFARPAKGLRRTKDVRARPIAPVERFAHDRALIDQRFLTAELTHRGDQILILPGEDAAEIEE